MRLHSLRTFALALPGASVARQWGDNLVFKVAGRMFLILALDGETVEAASFKVSPADFQRLTGIDGIVPAPYLARAGWVQLQDLGAIPAPMLEAQVRASHELVCARLPRKIRAQLG